MAGSFLLDHFSALSDPRQDAEGAHRRGDAHRRDRLGPVDE